MLYQLYQKQEREAALLARKQKSYMILDADDDDGTENVDESRKVGSHKKRFRKKTGIEEDDGDEACSYSYEKQFSFWFFF